MSALPDELPEAAVEALASGREELVEPDVLAALPDRPRWRAQVAEARGLSNDLGLALRQATEATRPPPPELEALVSEALAAQPPAPSRRRVAAAGIVGAAVTVALAGLSLGGLRLPSPALLVDAGRWLIKGAHAFGRVVELAPGGGLALGAAMLAGVALLTLPVRAWARGRGAWIALGLVGLLHAGSASAQRFTGEWPADERGVTLSVDDAPADAVLKEAAEAAGLDLVSHLRETPRVSVRVRDVGFREVAAAVLPSDDYELRRSGSLVVVRRAPRGSEAPADVTDEASTEDEGAADVAASDRTSFGADLVVAPGERVRSLVTMGGDADVRGEVLDDVLTMGGDVVVRSGAVVRGDVLTMGGDLRVEAGGEVRGHVATMGGEIEVAEGAQVPRRRSSADRPRRPSEQTLLARVASTGASFGLLFLLGLVLVGAMPERHANLVRAVVKQPLRSLLTGFVGALLIGVATVVLLVTLIGIPAAVVLALGAFLGAYVGVAVAASVVGAVLPLPWLRGRPIAQLGAGVATLFLCWWIPTGLGKFGVLLLATLGFGAVLLTRFGRRRVAPGPQA